MSKAKKLETALKSGDLSRITQAAQELLEELTEPIFIIRTLGRESYAEEEKYYLTGKNGEQLPFCLEDSENYVTKRWYFNGGLHREDGPAVEYSSGTKRWYLNGELIAKNKSPKNWDELVELSRIKQMMTE